jgi:hypothetical protein
VADWGAALHGYLKAVGKLTRAALPREEPVKQYWERRLRDQGLSLSTLKLDLQGVEAAFQAVREANVGSHHRARRSVTHRPNDTTTPLHRKFYVLNPKTLGIRGAWQAKSEESEGWNEGSQKLRSAIDQLRATMRKFSDNLKDEYAVVK